MRDFSSYPAAQLTDTDLRNLRAMPSAFQNLAARAGQRGAPGAKGEPGRPGLPGLTGARGEKGDKGEKGEPGQDGRDGIDGKDGLNGKDGAKGEKGDKGEPGTPGEDGKDGKNGIANPKDVEQICLNLIGAHLQQEAMTETTPRVGSIPIDETDLGPGKVLTYDAKKKSLVYVRPPAAVKNTTPFYLPKPTTVVTRTVTATAYTATDADHAIFCDATANAITINLPAVASNIGRTYQIIKTDSGGNAITIDGAASEKINGSNTASLANQYDKATIVCDGSAWYIF